MFGRKTSKGRSAVEIAENVETRDRLHEAWRVACLGVLMPFSTQFFPQTGTVGVHNS